MQVFTVHSGEWEYQGVQADGIPHPVFRTLAGAQAYVKGLTKGIQTAWHSDDPGVWETQTPGGTDYAIYQVQLQD